MYTLVIKDESMDDAIAKIVPKKLKSLISEFEELMP